MAVGRLSSVYLARGRVWVRVRVRVRIRVRYAARSFFSRSACSASSALRPW